MYRESLLGVALANALEELQPSCNFTEEQRHAIWDTFDQTFSEVLREAPVGTSITVNTNPPQLKAAEQRDEIDRGSSSPSSSSGVTTRAELADPALRFPLYRMQDGLWTIVLKDASVTVQEEGGKKETIKLDYLKCFLKDLSFTGTRGAPRRKRARQ